MIRLSLLAALVPLLGACGSSLPAPALGEHPLSTYVEVPYPPPAALAETVPDKPDRAGVIWVDGEWVYHGDGFVWRRGGWFVPPAGSQFAAWRTFYRSDGRLMMARGTWYDEKHERLRPPKPVTPAETPPNQVTSEFQTGR
jgi:hypothetical protein